MPIGASGDAIAGYKFAIQVDGDPYAQFKEVTGLSSEVQVIEHKETTIAGKDVVKKLPGQRKYGDITLKIGVTDDKKIFDWHKKVLDGKIDEARKNGSIILYDYAGAEKARWNFVNAWPSKMSYGSMSTTSNDILLQDVTLVVESIEQA
jgi:phage tail-like protein